MEGSNKTLWDLIHDFFRERSAAFRQWAKISPKGNSSHVEKLTFFTEKASNIDPLYVAASYGFVNIFQHADSAKVDFNIKDSYRKTPLNWAAQSRRTRIVKFLLHRHDVDPTSVEINAADEYGRLPLHEAAQRGYTDVIRLLLASGDVDVNVQDDQGDTPLHEACWSGVKAVQALLERTDLEINLKGKMDMTALSFAISMSKEDIALLLLERSNVDVNVQDKIGYIPLHEAIYHVKQKKST